MNRRIVRTYRFTDREVAEALIQWMRVKDIQAPEYVGNTNNTKWIKDTDGITVEWTADDEVGI